MNTRRPYFVLCLTLLFLLSAVRLPAADTLRFYNPSSSTATLSHYNDLIARFELQQDGLLTHISFVATGTGTGNFTLRVFGHEGGVPLPELMEDLLPPVTVTKTTSGDERILVALPRPVTVDNNQFFVMLEGLPSQIRLKADNRSPIPTCRSQDGGDQYYAFGRDNLGEWWVTERHALRMDAVVQQQPLPDLPWFRDYTAAAGIPAQIPGGSIAAADLDNDGFIDLVAGGHVFFNNRTGGFTDLTAAIGTEPEGVVLNPLIDINNDGLPDILLIYHDSTRQKVWINRGDRAFEVHTLQSRIPGHGAQSFSIADVNNDGFPDLFIGRLWTQYITTPDIVPNHLFLNDGNNDFTEATELIYPSGFVHRRTRSSAWCDYNNDGLQDLFVGNYFLEPDELWEQQADGSFTNVAQQKGIDINRIGRSGHATGADWADYDNDGNFDLLLPMLAHPGFILQFDHQPTTLFRNNGAPGYGFSGRKHEAGIRYEETHGGAAWADVNNDGLQDFFISAFYDCRYSDLYLQQEDHSFQLATSGSGLHRHHGAGGDACWFDYNFDGRPDLFTRSGAYLKLYTNFVPESGNSVQLKLTGTSVNKMAIGARAEVYAGGKKYIQEVNAGRGINTQRPEILSFGLGTAAQVDSVRVRWPGTTEWETFRQIGINNLNFLEEGGKTRLHTADAGSVIPQGAVLQIAPNPAENNFCLKIPGYHGTASVRIHDMLGRLVFTEQIFMNGMHTIRPGLSPGQYIVSADLGRELVHARIVIN